MKIVDNSNNLTMKPLKHIIIWKVKPRFLSSENITLGIVVVVTNCRNIDLNIYYGQKFKRCFETTDESLAPKILLNCYFLAILMSEVVHP